MDHVAGPNAALQPVVIDVEEIDAGAPAVARGGSQPERGAGLQPYRAAAVLERDVASRLIMKAWWLTRSAPVVVGGDGVLRSSTP